MMTPDSNLFAIDVSARFPHLSNAPIREAVLEIRSPSGVEWNEAATLSAMKERLVGFTTFRAESEIAGQVAVDLSQVTAQVGRPEWRGVRAASEDGLNVVQFNRESFVFSRLRPYTQWETFKADATRLWDIYSELGIRAEIERVGLRFINAVSFDEGTSSVELDDYIRTANRVPRGMEQLPMSDTFARDTLLVTGTPYAITVVRTVRGELKHESRASRSLIVDIDVFTIQSIAGVRESLDTHLEQMRFLKNKAFFGTLTEGFAMGLR
jgi:uncharacterized protein (TIGR04255 family)